MHNRYLENQVLSSDPIGLVRLLYAGAIDSISQARLFLQEGRIRERSAAISKAMQIVLELQASLDLERGREIARSLAQLYLYVQERLLEANAEQKPAPLEEALRLLRILEEGWKEIASQPAPPPVRQAASKTSMSWTV